MDSPDNQATIPLTNTPQRYDEFETAPDRLPDDTLRSWRLRRYLEWRELDPEMKERLSPEPEPFVFHE